MTAALICPALRRPPLTPDGFTATPWASAEEKAKIGNALLSFLGRGMPRQAFSKSLYRHLSQMFGQIAHYDLHGFWDAQLATTAARVSFLAELVAWPCWGQASHTWCDVEREIATRIGETGLVDAYRQALRAETVATDRATRARLTTHYEADPVSRPGPMQPPIPIQLGLL